MHAIHTACGMETFYIALAYIQFYASLHAIHTACGIETTVDARRCAPHRFNCMQSIPLAVLKRCERHVLFGNAPYCMQSIPLAVLKLSYTTVGLNGHNILHAIHTACGIETQRRIYRDPSIGLLHAIHTACGVEKGQIRAESLRG